MKSQKQSKAISKEKLANLLSSSLCFNISYNLHFCYYNIECRMSQKLSTIANFVILKSLEIRNLAW